MLSEFGVAPLSPDSETPRLPELAVPQLPVPQLPAPPRFQGHPPGAHPHGAPYHAHPMRVLRPTVIHRGAERPWRHWGHPEFVRPVYYWDWALVRSVTCTAEDSYGDQYPVTQSTWGGFGLPDMTTVEDDALDRCYEESGGDQKSDSSHLSSTSRAAPSPRPRPAW